MGIRGRSRFAGERYPAGKAKPRDEGDMRAPTLWRRIKDGAVKGGAHPYAGTVLGRLSIFGLLADAEVEAGFRVAEIVGRYERVSGAPHRTCASPAYEQGFGFSLDVNMLANANLARRFERRVRQARRAYEHLVDHIPERARDAVFTVCVEDREINSLLHKDLATVLRKLAVSFGFAAAPRKARGARRPEAGPLAGSLVDLLERWFTDHRASIDSFKLDTADPDIPTLIGFGRDRAGGEISDAVAISRGEVGAEDIEAAIIKAALAKGWSERSVR
ncbi:MAG: hypothetical protein JO328_03275 [Hyphomicrobiales bacterium]|nr:hypothetical protein [Hyphomicrobiales bacterium]MBV9428164.1 hypothetical protein [Bradyrhizobiaceae bacterium]